MATAAEFTPELSQEYLASLLNPIEESERASVGLARQEGESAGLVGQAATGAKVGAARAAAAGQMQGAVAGFNEKVAAARYGERMTDEERAFKDTERQKQEDFQKSMQTAGFEHENAVEAGRKHAAEQGALVGLAGGVLSAGVGGYFGGLGRAAGTAAAGAAAGAAESEESDE